MRTLAFVLSAAVIGAVAVFYGMVMSEGEDDGARKVILVPRPDAAPQAGTATNWAEYLERHDPPLAASQTPFQGADGAALTLADFKGKGLVVNLWATWCAPCVREMPSLNRLQKEVAADGIPVVAISSDRGGLDLVEVFMATHKLDALKPYLDPLGEFTRSTGGRGLPRTYIINAAGEVAASYVGPAEWDSPDLIAAIRELAR